MSAASKQQDVEIAAAELDQSERERKAAAALVEDADDEAGGGDDHHQLGGGDAGAPERGGEAAQRHALALVGPQRAQHDHGGGGVKRRHFRLRLHEEQRVDQHHEGHDEMPAGAQHLARLGQIVGEELDAVARRHQVDLHEDGEIIKHRRNDRGDHHLGVGNFQELGHQEGGGAHHRRHELAAGRGIGFDGAGIDRRIARALHQRDGHHARPWWRWRWRCRRWCRTGRRPAPRSWRRRRAGGPWWPWRCR